MAAGEPRAAPRVRVIFCDVDGVLALWRSQALRERRRGREATKAVPGLIFAADPQTAPLEASCVAELAWLAREAGGARVVLSSTWRRQPDMVDFVRRVVAAAGVEWGGVTEYDGRGRGHEVLAWLAAQLEDGSSGGGRRKIFPPPCAPPEEKVVVESFVILDDEHAESFDACRLRRRVVRTDMASQTYFPGPAALPKFDPGAGLNRERARAALDILNTPLDDAEWETLLSERDKIRQQTRTALRWDAAD